MVEVSAARYAHTTAGREEIIFTGWVNAHGTHAANVGRRSA